MHTKPRRHAKKVHALVEAVEAPTKSLREKVAALRARHRAELAEMAESTQRARAEFVREIQADVSQRIVPEVQALLADIRTEHAAMAERGQRARAQFVRSVRAWVG